MLLHVDTVASRTNSRLLPNLFVFSNYSGPIYDHLQTNQRAEVLAVIQALRHAQQFGQNKILVRTDSQYVAKGT